MKKLIIIILLYFLLAGCQNQAEKTAERQNTSRIRIVSLVPSLTEILFELDMGQYLVGVSSYCTYPDSVHTIEKLGGLYDVSMEKLIRLQPDYILVDRSRNWKKHLQKVETIDPEIIALRTETIEDIYSNIQILGKTFHRQAKAARLVRIIQDSIAYYQISPRKENIKRVLLIVNRAPGKMAQIYAAGQNTFINEISEMCGLQNVINGDGYLQVNSEFIYKADIDYVLEFNAGIQDEQKTDIVEEWQLFWNEKNKSVPICVFNEDYMVIPGPRVYWGIKRIAEMVKEKRGCPKRSASFLL